MNRRVEATKHPSIIMKPTDPACKLPPILHEITCIEVPAAFLAILSSSYDSGDLRVGKRPCKLFKCISHEINK